MKQSAAIDMLKRIRDEHVRTYDADPKTLGYFIGAWMPQILEIIHQLEELDPEEIREASQ